MRCACGNVRVTDELCTECAAVKKEFNRTLKIAHRVRSRKAGETKRIKAALVTILTDLNNGLWKTKAMQSADYSVQRFTNGK